MSNDAEKAIGSAGVIGSRCRQHTIGGASSREPASPGPTRTRGRTRTAKKP